MRRHVILTCFLAAVGLGFVFQNCSQVGFTPSQQSLSSQSNQGQSAVVLKTGQATIDPSRPNPPLDLFVIVDNSASMLGHQIDLGAAFDSVFKNNTENLSSFDTNIYVLSTASTVHPQFLGQIPSVNPSSIRVIPSLTDVANQAITPGSLFGIWKTQTGSFGSAPFQAQFYPSPVLDLDPADGVVKPFISIKKRGTRSQDEYLADLNSVAKRFQNRIAFLNPTNQLDYSKSTDVSSGLCTMARVLKHSGDFINPGDSAAFVIVSDDDDRLNVRNPNGNQCLESMMSSSQVIDGTCGHYETTFTYTPGSSLTYQYDAKVTYPSGTKVGYSLPISGETCNIKYNSGYNYTWTYTAIKTRVLYTKCNKVADGTCLDSTVGATATIDGNFVGSNGACTSDVSGLVSSPLKGTTFNCSPANMPNQIGTPGVDSASTGSACSSALLSGLAGDGNKTDIRCEIGTAVQATKSIAGQPVGACTNYCAANLTTYPACALVSKSQTRTSASFNLAFNGITCTSTCPDSTKCGSGTITDYIVSTYGAGSTCNSTSAILSTLVVSAATNADGTPLTGLSSLTNLTVRNSSGTIVCKGASTMNDCVTSLQVNAVPTFASTADNSSLNVPNNVTCSSSCAVSGGLCDANTYSSISDFLGRAKRSLCKSSTSKAASSFKLTFNVNANPANASCASKCSDVTQGSCDGHGYGAADGSTVSDYVANVLGGAQTCQASTAYVVDGSPVTVDASSLTAACPSAASPYFKASGSAHAGNDVRTSVTGGAPSDSLSDYIRAQIPQVFGLSQPVLAVITQVAGDNLVGTDIGTSYINLATSLGSDQISSIKGDYSAALSKISQFIVRTAKNSIVLPLTPGEVVVSVSVQHQGSTEWQDLKSTDWSWSGQTLSFKPSANLNIGDQIQYQYH